MQAMQLTQLGKPLTLTTLPITEPQSTQVLIKISACGVCRTDLHIVDGELAHPNLPLTPGHQIVGHVIKLGSAVTSLKIGQRVGVPWLGYSCGACYYCQAHQENLCEQACYTGYQIDGGFAEYCVADAHYCFAIPDNFSDLQAAPLLCAGLIGYRSYRKIGNAQNIGFFGFGAAAHILIQIAHYQQRKVYAFTRDGDALSQQFAKKLGAVWTGSSQQSPPQLLDAAIIFAPVGNLIPLALKAVRKGGIVVCAGIHMSEIPSFSYDLLWGERSIVSVANLTREDGIEFLALAPKIPIVTEVTQYSLINTNQALADLRQGKLTGAAVVVINSAGKNSIV